MQWKPVLARSARGTKYAQFANKLCVHVNKRGDFVLSRASHLAIGTPEFVQVVSDGNGRIGFTPGRRGDPCTYTVQDAGNKNTRRLSAKAVTRKLGLIEGKSKTYTLYIEDGVLVFNLGQKPTYR